MIGCYIYIGHTPTNGNESLVENQENGKCTATDTEVDVAASMVWSVYRGLELGKKYNELLPDDFGKTEVVQGDEGVGTVIKLIFPPGTSGIGYMKEKFINIDDVNFIKETELMEGDLKEMGFRIFRIRLEIIAKDAKSSIIRSSIVYELDDEQAHNASLVSTKTLEILAQLIGKHLMENHGNA